MLCYLCIIKETSVSFHTAYIMSTNGKQMSNLNVTHTHTHTHANILKHY